jgi:hypothetical protein
MSKEVFCVNEELIEFAEWFSANYKELTTGIEYLSKNKTYKLLYLDEFSGGQSYNFSRIKKSNGVIEINKQYTSESGIDSDFVYFMIIWVVIKWWMDFKRDSFLEIEVDRIAIKHYMEMGKSFDSVIFGMKRQFALNPTDANIERYNEITSKE